MKAKITFLEDDLPESEYIAESEADVKHEDLEAYRAFIASGGQAICMGKIIVEPIK